MNMYMFLSRAVLTVCLLCFCLTQNSYGQEITGKWKCSKEMFEEWGLRYASMKGKVRFYKDKSFKVVVKGRSHLGHKFWTFRNINIKINGIYTLRNDSLVMSVKPEKLKCYVDPGIDDPRLSPYYDKWLERSRSTWNSAETFYESYVTQTDFHEQVVWEKMFGIWNNEYLFEQTDNEHLRLGKEIILER